MVGAVGAVREITPEVIGTTTGKESWEYSWRDSAIYAVGVGAKEDEIEYQYEAGIKAIPTYAMVPVWGTFGITPHRDLPDNVSFRLGLDRQNSLDMAHKLILHKPIDATGGSFTIEDVVTDVFDRRGKGAVVRTTMTGRDASGEKVFTNIADNYFGVCSAPGFADFPKSEVLFPDREPDHAVRETLGANQNLLYRLAGDTNRVHVDVDEARAQGFDRPIMQGFCSFGYACRMAIKELFPHEPERVRSIEAQMRSPLFPGQEVELRLWQVDAHRAFFRLMCTQTGAAVLERGALEWV